jgi:hypothetical protein
MLSDGNGLDEMGDRGIVIHEVLKWLFQGQSPEVIKVQLQDR